MRTAEDNTLRVPGATLHYQTYGTGPMLLLLYGMAGAGGSGSLVDELAEHFTVVTFDRRGSARSPLDDPAEPARLETDSDDAHRLLSALTNQPVLVFGASNGALLGLDLAIRHPERVRGLVAHEPPAPRLLPDPDRTHAERAQAEVDQTYRREGQAAAMGKLAAIAGLAVPGDRQPGDRPPQSALAAAADRAFFFARVAPATHRYQLDVDALRAATVPIIPAAGSDSGTIFPRRCAIALAELLGTRLVEFPGGHAGWVGHTRAFAARLREVLDGVAGASS